MSTRSTMSGIVLRAAAIAAVQSRPPTRSLRVTVLLAFVIAMNAVDLMLTLHFMRTDGLLESNPIVRWIVDLTGSALVLFGWKLFTLATCTGLLYRLRNHRQAESAAILASAIMVWLMLRWIEYMGVVAGLDPTLLLSGATRFH